jgi:hypothetical protein
LEGSGLVVGRGDLIEYQVEGREQLLAGIVVHVARVGYSGFSSGWPAGTQFISICKITSRRLPKPEALSDGQIKASLVTRKLERRGKIPLPPPVPKTLFPPLDEEKPWKIWMLLTPEEWKAVSRWYGYSLRSLVYDGSWIEMGRYTARDEAYSIMQALINRESRYLAHLLRNKKATRPSRRNRPEDNGK